MPPKREIVPSLQENSHFLTSLPDGLVRRNDAGSSVFVYTP